MTPIPSLSVVVPVFNEEAIIAEFHRRAVAALEPMAIPFELIFVNDGSRDTSLSKMAELNTADPRVKVINLSRNFGHQVAITAGLDHARGEAIVVMDADLQDPPEVIPELVSKWRDGYDVVYAVRAKRQGETAFKKLTAGAFYRLLHRITNVDIPVDTGDFRLMSRRAADALRAVREKHRFVRGLVAWVGFKQVGVTHVRDARYAGETKYPLKKMLKFAFDGITSFSFVPLQAATYLGFTVSCVSFLAMIGIIAQKLLLPHTIVQSGWASLLAAVLFLGGVQLITIGIIGEYVGRIYDEVKGRPLYFVQDLMGLEPAPDRREVTRSRG